MATFTNIGNPASILDIVDVCRQETEGRGEGEGEGGISNVTF